MIIKEDAKWLIWGNQKQAVVRVITRPMTPTRIFQETKKIVPGVSFGDVSNIIRELERRAIIKCLTPEKRTGRIYFLTNHGRRLVWHVFGTAIDAEERNLDWYKYSRVLAGKTRKYFLLEIYNQRGFYPEGIGLAALRKKVSRIYPLTLSQAFCIAKDLQKEDLITVAGHAKKRNSKLYKLTPEGMQIVEYILRNTQQNHDHAF